MAAQQQTVATDSAQVELTCQLASEAPSEQKQILCEKLYPLIHNMHARTLFFTIFGVQIHNALFYNSVQFSSVVIDNFYRIIYTELVLDYCNNLHDK